MNISCMFHPVSRLATWFSVFMLTLGLISCGGGGGGDSDESQATIRPKTLDGIVLTMDGNKARFEFIRNTGSPAAVRNGDVESGTFIYTLTSGFRNLSNYENLQGDLSDFQYPISTASATYTYRAINDSSGVLTMVATGVYDNFVIIIPPGGIVSNNGSFIRPFASYSPFTFTPNTRVVEIAITFTNQGSFVTSDTVTFRLPESPVVSTLDTVRIPTTITLATLGLVPLNYNPVVVERAPSRIAPATLTNRLMVATNGIPDPTKDFTIQFVADAVTNPGTAAADSIEVGKGVLSVFDPSLVPPRLSPVGIALDYTWQRIVGTDTGSLILSNIPSNQSLPFSTSLNGRMVLNFSGLESGTYTGVADADTANPADVTGSFFMSNNQTPVVVGN